MKWDGRKLRNTRREQNRLSLMRFHSEEFILPHQVRRKNYVAFVFMCVESKKLSCVKLYRKHSLPVCAAIFRECVCFVEPHQPLWVE